MLKHVIQMSGALSLLALTASGQTAEPVEYLKLSDIHIKPSGYVVGSYTFSKSDSESSTTGGPTASADSSSDRFDLDAAKFLFAVDYKPVSGTFSLYYPGGSGSEIYMLDAYATYDFGGGSTLTGGKFLSWLGYEAFDIPNMAQITYAYAGFNPIPGYHNGLKYNFTSPEISYGIALLDSLYGTTGYESGDGSLKTDLAVEGYVSYTGVAGLTLWGGFGYQSEDDETLDGDGTSGSVFIFNTWASYTIDKSNFGAEFIFTTVDDDDTVLPFAAGGYDAVNFLIFYSYQASEKLSTAFRVGIDMVEDNNTVFGPGVFDSSESSSFRVTVAPSYKVTENLKIVGEVTYSHVESDFKSVVGPVRTSSAFESDAVFVGVQARFTF